MQLKINEAIKRNYPLMGFSSWHRVVGSYIRYENSAHNAVIVIKGKYNLSIVIKGEPFPDTNYFHPHTIAFEKCARYPNGKHIKLKPYKTPSQISDIIYLELYHLN